MVVSWVRVGLALVAMATVALPTVFGGDSRASSWSQNVAGVGPGQGHRQGSNFAYSHDCLGNAHLVPIGPAVTGNPIEPAGAEPVRGLLNSWEMFTLFHAGLPVYEQSPILIRIVFMPMPLSVA